MFLQVSLGGLRALQDQKNKVRESYGLPPLPEDTYEVCRNMRASSPPASAADLIEQQMPRKIFRGKRVSYHHILEGFHFNFYSLPSYDEFTWPQFETDLLPLFYCPSFTYISFWFVGVFLIICTSALDFNCIKCHNIMQLELEPQGALIAHPSTKSTSVIS